jgi:hypothetical protein
MVAKSKSLTDSFYVNAGKSKTIKVIADLNTTADTDLTKISTSISL